MSQIFSYNFDNDINLRSNSLITNELHVKDPISGDYKAIIPGQGSGEAEVPYYVDTNEINFGSDRTQITGSTAIFPGSVTLKDPSFEVSKNIHINKESITMDNLDDVVSLNATGILATKSGVPATPVLWSEIQEKRDYLTPTRLYFNNLANGAVSTMFSIGGGYFSKIAPVEMITGAGTNTTSLINQAKLNYYGLSVIGPTSDTNTYYYRNVIKQNIAGGGQKSFTILDAEKVVNNLKDVDYLKPERIEFSDGSGMSEGTLHYRDTEGHLQQKSILSIVEDSGALPNYIKSNSIQFNDDSDPGFSRIEQDVIGTNIFSAEGYGDGISTQYGPSTILRRESGVNKTTNVNDVIDVTNKFKDVTGTVGNINAVISKFATSATSSLTATAIYSMLNKLNGINSTAAQIDAAVANSGGTTYPYLKTNSIEIDGEAPSERKHTINEFGLVLSTYTSTQDHSSQLYTNAFHIRGSDHTQNQTMYYNQNIVCNSGSTDLLTLNIPAVASAFTTKNLIPINYPLTSEVGFKLEGHVNPKEVICFNHEAVEKQMEFYVKVNGITLEGFTAYKNTMAFEFDYVKTTVPNVVTRFEVTPGYLRVNGTDKYLYFWTGDYNTTSNPNIMRGTIYLKHEYRTVDGNYHYADFNEGKTASGYFRLKFITDRHYSDSEYARRYTINSW